MLIIKDLHANVEDKEILKGVNLSINAGESHALMGQNGSGKSTLSHVLMGSPFYEVTSGDVSLNGNNLLEMEPHERSLAGLFLSFQYPSEIPGVTIRNYLRVLYNKHHQTKLSPIKFKDILAEKLAVLDMSPDFADRALNEGFSGGEKKRMEMLQMLIVEPKLVILDEVDSGLDVDALKVVGKAVGYIKEKSNTAVLLITHYARILKHIPVEHVHIMQNGQIVKSATEALAHEIEQKGYANS